MVEQLETLNLYGVSRISEEGVSQLVCKSKGLLCLNIRGTNLLIEASQKLRIQSLTAKCNILTGRQQYYESVFLRAEAPKNEIRV